MNCRRSQNKLFKMAIWKYIHDHWELTERCVTEKYDRAPSQLINAFFVEMLAFKKCFSFLCPFCHLMNITHWQCLNDLCALSSVPLKWKLFFNSSFIGWRCIIDVSIESEGETVFYILSMHREYDVQAVYSQERVILSFDIILLWPRLHSHWQIIQKIRKIIFVLLDYEIMGNQMYAYITCVHKTVIN